MRAGVPYLGGSGLFYSGERFVESNSRICYVWESLRGRTFANHPGPFSIADSPGLLVNGEPGFLRGLRPLVRFMT